MILPILKACCIIITAGFYYDDREDVVLKIKNWKNKLFTGALLIACLAIYLLFQIPCPFLYFLHIPCLGCGMTRAYIRLLHLDIAGAFAMHAMFWSVPVLGLYYLFDWQLFKNKWVDHIVLILLGLGFLLNWIVHLF